MHTSNTKIKATVKIDILWFTHSLKIGLLWMDYLRSYVCVCVYVCMCVIAMLKKKHEIQYSDPAS